MATCQQFQRLFGNERQRERERERERERGEKGPQRWWRPIAQVLGSLSFSHTRPPPLPHTLTRARGCAHLLSNSMFQQFFEG
jgi:hypothetical protein